MKKFTFLLLASFGFSTGYTALSPQEIASMDQHKQKPSDPEILIIPPKNRAEDLKEAFEFLQKENVTNQITFTLRNGSKLTGISEVTVLKGGTMLIFKLATTTGTKYQILPVEEVTGIHP